MLGALMVVALIVVIGTRASDALELRQQETILGNLPDDEARAYYQVLRRRVRKVRLLRALSLLALLVLFYSYKHHLASTAAPPGQRPVRSLLWRTL